MEAVIVSTARTPLCKSWKGALNMTHGAKMGAHVVHAAMDRAKVDCQEVVLRENVGNRSLIVFDRGDEVTVQAGEEGIRFLLVSGKPIAECVPSLFGRPVGGRLTDAGPAVAQTRQCGRSVAHTVCETTTQCSTRTEGRQG